MMRIEKMMRDFFWGGGKVYENGNGSHLVKWDKVARPKTRGGLGIGNVEKKSRVLLAKWLWRFPLERTSLWHSIIRSKYPNGWDENMVKERLYLKSIPLFLVFFALEVGNGKAIRFWGKVEG